MIKGLISFKDFVNLMGPSWEKAYNSKTLGDTLNDGLYAIATIGDKEKYDFSSRIRRNVSRSEITINPSLYSLGYCLLTKIHNSMIRCNSKGRHY
jgi:hypothetical protein